MKEFYNTWNAGGAKKLEVIVVSGDRDEAGFKATTDGMPWVAVPLGRDTSGIKAKVPCTGYPTPGVVCGKTGKVIDPDVFGRVAATSLDGWLDAAK